MFLLARIGGFSDKNFTNAVKLAQTAQDAADKATASAVASGAKLQQSLDGKITVSTVAPGNDDAAGHNKGDVWYVTSSDGSTYTEMYNFSGISWTQQQWDQRTLSVKYLSALSANLGNVQAGNINGVKISSSTINGGTITENSNNGKITLDSNGFSAVSGSSYFKFVASGSNHYTVAHGGIRTDDITANYGNIGDSYIEGQTFAAYDANTHIGQQGTWTYLAENVKCGATNGGNSAISPTHGIAIYFHNQSGSTIDIHAGAVYAGGSKLKSALSAKRDVTDYSPDEALSAVMNTDIKKWKYKDSDNSADSQHIGPIIDDVNVIGKKSVSIANDMISTDENGNYYLNESNTISILLAALKKSNQRIDELSYRITQLERKSIK